MGRARNIKPGFFTNDELVELPYETRLLFIGLWSIADRDGRLVNRPKKIKMEIFPADNVDCVNSLDQLAASGFITRYEVDGFKVIEIINFTKHQAPHSTEKDSALPDPEGFFTVNERTKNGGITGKFTKTRRISPLPNDGPQLTNVNPPTNNALIPDSGYLIPDSLIPDSGYPNPEDKPTVEGEPPTERVEKAQVIEVFDYWRQVMGHKTSKLDAKREKAIRARLKNGYTVGNLCTAIDGCKLDPWSQGANDRNTVFDDIELICRDGPKVDKFIAIAGRGQKTARPANTQGTFDTLKRYVDKNGEN